MDSVRWQRVKNLYDLASARPSGERAAFLADACQGDEALLREANDSSSNRSRQPLSSSPGRRPLWLTKFGI